MSASVDPASLRGKVAGTWWYHTIDLGSGVVTPGWFDTRKVVLRTAQLRSEKAKLIGYENWAAYQLEEQTAKNVPTVNKLLADLAPPAWAFFPSRLNASSATQIRSRLAAGSGRRKQAGQG